MAYFPQPVNLAGGYATDPRLVRPSVKTMASQIPASLEFPNETVKAPTPSRRFPSDLPEGLGASGDRSAPTYYRQRPSQNYAIPAPWTQAPLNNFLLGGYLTAPAQVSNDLNSAFADAAANWERASQANSDRNLALAGIQAQVQQANANRGLVKDILGSVLGGGGVGGLGSLGGQRMTGYYDTNSGQAASLGGSSSTGINVPNIQPRDIQDASRMARGMAQPPAAAMRQNAQAAIPALYGQYAAAAAKEGSRNAVDIEKQARESAASLSRARELAMAEGGLDNAQYLANLNQDNSQYRTRTVTPLIRALLSGMVDQNLNLQLG